MFTFNKDFTERVAARLRYLLKEEADPKNPYVAILYAVPKDKSVDQVGTVVVSACNTERISGDANAHAERNILKMAAKALRDERIDSSGTDIDPSCRKTDFYLFVNTRPCPECTKAILNDRIFYVVLLYDNAYKKDESESLMRCKEEKLKDRFHSLVEFKFGAIDDNNLNLEFQRLTEDLKRSGARPSTPAASASGAISAMQVTNGNRKQQPQSGDERRDWWCYGAAVGALLLAIGLLISGHENVGRSVGVATFAFAIAYGIGRGQIPTSF